MRVRFKRLVAYIIDWNIILSPFTLISFFLSTYLRQQSEVKPLIPILMFLVIPSGFALFILRDVIFKGRSLGKRIFGLYIYDRNTLKYANAGRCFLRNIFFSIYIVDAIILLVFGRTIGDRAAGTLVMSKQDFESYSEEKQQSLTVSKKRKIKKVILILVIVFSCLIAFIGLILLALNARKDTAEYIAAYNYLIESEAFEELNVDESKIVFNEYRLTKTIEKNGLVNQTARIGFIINLKSFEVVCHIENDTWQVCEECTHFR